MQTGLGIARPIQSRWVLRVDSVITGGPVRAWLPAGRTVHPDPSDVVWRLRQREVHRDVVAAGGFGDAGVVLLGHLSSLEASRPIRDHQHGRARQFLLRIFALDAARRGIGFEVARKRAAHLFVPATRGPAGPRWLLGRTVVTGQ